MVKIPRVFLVAVLLLALPATVLAQGADLSGTWELFTGVSLAPVDGVTTAPSADTGTVPIFDCNFQGTANIFQDGTEIFGTSDLILVEGSPSCPAEMSADVTGIVNGTQVEMGLLMGGNVGEATFSGSVGLPALRTKAAVPADETVSGRFSATSGPFTGAGGQWSAIRVQAGVIAIPTLGGGALTLLVALLLGAGIIVLRRH